MFLHEGFLDLMVFSLKKVSFEFITFLTLKITVTNFHANITLRYLVALPNRCQQ